MQTTSNDKVQNKPNTLTREAVSQSCWRDFRAFFHGRSNQARPAAEPGEVHPAEHQAQPGRSMLALRFSLSLCACAASAQSWQTVDDFQYAGTNAKPLAVTIDPAVNVFVAGSGNTYPSDPTLGGVHGLIRKSTDGGASWLVADDLPSMSIGSTYTGMGSDVAGNLYACGSFGAAGSARQSLTAQSTDRGLTWNNVDVYAPQGSLPWSVATDLSGNVFVAGYTNNVRSDGSTVSVWLVRKGTVGGSSWSTVDAVTNFGGALAHAVLCHPSWGTFVAGYANGASTLWTVRRSLDGGNTWATVDASVFGYAEGIGADAAGNIYVVGTGTSSFHWLVRKSSNGGASWATVDDYYPCVTVTNSLKPFRTSTTCPNTALANAFAADAYGNLFAAGYLDMGNTTQWVVRENPGGNTSWRTVDSFNYAGRGSLAYGIAADASGHVYVAGQGNGATGGFHWIVRRN
jgi:hypothetical protein